MSSAMLPRMTSPPKKLDLNQVVARNLRYFMERSADCKNPNALSVKSRGAVSPQTVRNLTDPKQRPTTTEKFAGYPTIDKLAVVAGLLGVEVWELLHPDVEHARRAQKFYELVQAEFTKRVEDDEPLADAHNKHPSRKPKVA